MLNAQSLFVWLDHVYASCTEALYWNWQREISYRIRHHDMANFVFAECKIVENKITAILRHDTEKQITVHGYESAKSYR